MRLLNDDANYFIIQHYGKVFFSIIVDLSWDKNMEVSMYQSVEILVFHDLSGQLFFFVLDGYLDFFSFMLISYSFLVAFEYLLCHED